MQAGLPPSCQDTGHLWRPWTRISRLENDDLASVHHFKRYIELAFVSLILAEFWVFMQKFGDVCDQDAMGT